MKDSVGGQTVYSFARCALCNNDSWWLWAVHPRPVHLPWHGVQVEHKHREAVVQVVVVLVHINHQLCPGQALLACCHVQAQAGGHLAQLRLVRLLKQLPDELASSVEAALPEVVHLLSILLLWTFSKVEKIETVHEKCHLVSRKKLFHPIKGILAAGFKMKIVWDRVLLFFSSHRHITQLHDYNHRHCIAIEMKIGPCNDIDTDHWHLPGHCDLCQYDSNCELTINYNLA